MLDEQDAHALAAQAPQQIGERLLFGVAQARRGLVEQQEHRVGRQRARDLDQALLAQRQAARGFVQVLGQSHALDLASGLGQEARFLGAVDAQHRLHRVLAPAQVRADRDVLEHRHGADQVHVLEGARDAAARDLRGAQAVDVLAAEARCCRRRPAARR